MMTWHLSISLLVLAAAASGCSSATEAQQLDRQGSDESASEQSPPTIDDLLSGEVTELRPNTKTWLRLPWIVPLMRADLIEAWTMIEGAERVHDPAPSMLIDGRDVLLHTRLGDYRFFVGERKTVDHAYSASLTPVGDPDGRATLHWALPPADGKKLVRLLDRRLADNAQLARRQGYVSTRK